MDRLILIVFIMGLIAAGIVWLIGRKRPHGIYKYIPALTLYTLGVISFVKGNWYSQAMEDLGYKGLAVMLIATGIIAQIAALLISLSEKYKK